MGRCTRVSVRADISRYTYLYVPTCVHMCTHIFVVHALNKPLKTMKMLTKLFLIGDPKFTDDHPIAMAQMEKLQGMVSKGEGAAEYYGKTTTALGMLKEEHYWS